MTTTRFAPSPTGRLHKGHAYSALTAYRAARDAGGRFILRIEDIDPTRCKPEFEAGIYEDLAWLGLEWETPVRRQSDHMDDYGAVIETLNNRGLLYRCFRTRKQILDAIGHAPHGPGDAARPGPHHPDEEAALLEQGAAYAWRLSLERARDHLGEVVWNSLSFYEQGTGPVRVQPETAGDVVLARKDAGTAYHLAVTHDDALQNITHVIRGQDLFEATHIQRLIQTLMNWPAPTYHHHPLISGPDGKRYAKRDQSITLKALRDGGLTPQALKAELGF
jgi:glutamyl-Q tRNA(Asp) synthetase